MTRAAQSESMEQRTHRILQSPFCHSAFRSERQEISLIARPLATLLGGSALLRSLWKAYLLRFAFSSPGESVFNRSAVSFIGALLIFVIPFAETFAAQSNWKEEWDKTLRVAEAEGQLTLYGCCYEYDRIVEEFRKKHPKIKVKTVLGAGGQLGTRVLAERRGEEYLPDVFRERDTRIH